MVEARVNRHALELAEKLEAQRKEVEAEAARKAEAEQEGENEPDSGAGNEGRLFHGCFL